MIISETNGHHIMLTLHHLNNSRSQRLIWMLEELGIEYNIQQHMRDATTNLAPPELKAVHALGRSPVLTDDDVVIAETGAIIEYLADKHGQQMIPEKDTQAYRDYVFWLHFAEGSLMPPMIVKMIFDKVKAAPIIFLFKGVIHKTLDKIMAAYFGPNLQTSLQYIEEYLEGREWFAGDRVSGADIQMIFPLEGLVAKGSAQQLPNITAYVKRVHALESYQRGLKKGPDYAYA